MYFINMLDVLMVVMIIISSVYIDDILDDFGKKWVCE